MSTTFGVKIPGIDEPVEVLYRSGSGLGKLRFRVLNPLIMLLPDSTPLIALDNSQQGIETVYDFLEAINNEIAKLSRERIKPKVIMSGVGSINENDVKAVVTTPGATVIGFNVKTDARASALAERSEIKIMTFDVIYELTEKVSELLTEREPRIEVEEVSGSAKVLKLFNATKNKQVLGARVLTGNIVK